MHQKWVLVSSFSLVRYESEIKALHRMLMPALHFHEFPKW